MAAARVRYDNDGGEQPGYETDRHSGTARRAYFAGAESVSGDVVVQGAIRSRVNFPK